MSKNVDVENHLEEDGTSTFMVFPSDPGMSKKSFQIEVGYRDNYFHSRPRIWTCFSFIHFHILLSSQESQGEAAISWLEILYGFQQSLIILLAPHQDGPSKVGDVIVPPGLWSTSVSLSRGCRQQDLPRRSLLEHSGHVAEPPYLRSLYSEEKGLHIQGVTNSTDAHFLMKWHVVIFSQNSYLCRLRLG